MEAGLGLAPECDDCNEIHFTFAGMAIGSGGRKAVVGQVTAFWPIDVAMDIRKQAGEHLPQVVLQQEPPCKVATVHAPACQRHSGGTLRAISKP